MSVLVVGYDASDSARAALAVAVEVAKAFGDDIHVVAAYEVGRMGSEVADLAAALRERAERLGAQVTAEIVDDPPHVALTEVGERLNARMLVVGTRGEGPFRSAFIVSTPHKLLQTAGRPVLVVPE